MNELITSIIGELCMHILVIGQYYPPDVGGSHRRTYNAVKGLEQIGHELEIITAIPHYPLGKIPSEYNRKILSIEREGNHRLIRVWMPSVAHHGFARRLFMYLLFSFTALLALPITKRPDVIWATSPSVFSSFPAMIYSIIKRAPVVRNIDDLWPETAAQLGFLSKRLQRIGEFGAKLAYLLSSTVTPISSAYIPTLVTKYGVQSNRIFVAEVGVDTTIFQEKPHPDTRRAKHFKIVYSGLLGVAYDFSTILEAAKKLQESNNYHFLIRGVGEMENFIRAKIDEFNLTNVTLSTEFLEQETLTELLSSADALILPMKDYQSSDSGLPTKLFEYMACGRPIICMSAGESAKIVKEANCGIIVPPNDPSGLVTAILELEGNTSRVELRRNGRKYAEENYSLEKIAIKLEAAFNHAIKH